VYAVGDATTQPIKQGGLAAQQADAVAAGIARQAGAEVDELPFKPTLRGILLGGALPSYLRSEAAVGLSVASEHPLWWPGGASGKVAGRS
jgi:sulfide:quinone oxidoreductase